MVVPIISHICHYDPMNHQKNADIHKNRDEKKRGVKILGYQENHYVFLPSRDNEFVVAVILQNREKGGL